MEVVYEERAPDLETYNRLRREAGWGTYDDPEVLSEGLRNSLFHVRAVADGRTVGMARVVGDGAVTFYVQDVIVEAPFRGRGIGDGLMRRVMRFIESRAADGAVVGLMSAKGKEGFYERFGFIGRPNERYGKGMIVPWEGMRQ